MQDGVLLAGVDLGSNSFRLEIGRHEHAQLHRTDYLKETVRQGGGLDEARNLTPEAMQLAAAGRPPGMITRDGLAWLRPSACAPRAMRSGRGWRGLENADVLGFGQPELHRLGLLVLGHRGKLRALEAELADAELARQLLCLRLAVILCHARRNADLRGVRLRRCDRGFALALQAGWLRSYPQSAHLLREEAAAWQKTASPLALV